MRLETDRHFMMQTGGTLIIPRQGIIIVTSKIMTEIHGDARTMRGAQALDLRILSLASALQSEYALIAAKALDQ